MQIKIKYDFELSDFIVKGFRLFLFGETHGFVNDSEVQEKLLAHIKPNIFIYELLEDKKITTINKFNEYLSKPDSEQFSVISTFGEIKPTISLAKKYCKSMVGCDIKNMCRKDNSFLNETNLSNKKEIFESKLLKKREIHQAKIINKTLNKEKGIIFVSIGAYHLRRESHLFNTIKDKFVICYPTINGIQKFEPQKGMEEGDIEFIITDNESYLK